MKTKIQNLINSARKSRNYSALSAYQNILSNIQSLEARGEVSDAKILKIIKKEREIYEESADLFKDKKPLESTTYRIKSQICADLLADLSPEGGVDVEKVVEEVLASGDFSKKDFGKIMGILKEKNVDMAKASVIVRGKLK